MPGLEGSDRGDTHRINSGDLMKSKKGVKFRCGGGGEAFSLDMDAPEIGRGMTCVKGSCFNKLCIHTTHLVRPAFAHQRLLSDCALSVSV